MIDFIKTYIRFFLLHKWNKISHDAFDVLEENWTNKPTSGMKKWLYDIIKRKNGYIK